MGLEIDCKEINNLIGGYESSVFSQIEHMHNAGEDDKMAFGYDERKEQSSADILKQVTDNFKTLRMALMINNQKHGGVDLQTYNAIERFHKGQASLSNRLEHDVQTANSIRNRVKGHIFDRYNDESSKLSNELKKTRISGVELLPPPPDPDGNTL